MEKQYEEMEVQVAETTVAPDDIDQNEAPVEEVAQDTPVGDASGNTETNEFATSGMGKPNQIYDELCKTADRSVHNDPEAEKSIIDSVEPQLKELEEGLAFDKHESDDFTSNIKVGAGANGGLQLDNQEETSAYREIVERDAKIHRTEVLDLGKGDSTTEAFAKAMDQETEGKGFLADSANKNETAVISDSEQKPDMYELYKDKKMDYTVEDRETGEMEQAGAQSNEKFNDPELMTPKDDEGSEPMEADMPETSEEVADPEVEENNPGTTEDEMEVNEDEEMAGSESEEDEVPTDAESEEVTPDDVPEEAETEEPVEEPEDMSEVDETGEGSEVPSEGGVGGDITAEVIHDNREEEDQEETVSATLGGSSDIFENSDQARSLNEPDKDTEKEIVPPNESQPAENNAEEVNEPECQGEIEDGQTFGEIVNAEERVDPEDRSNDSYEEEGSGDVYEGHEPEAEETEVEPESEVEEDDAEAESPADDEPEMEDEGEIDGGETEEDEEVGEESFRYTYNPNTRFDNYDVPEGGIEAHLLDLLKEY